EFLAFADCLERAFEVPRAALRSGAVHEGLQARAVVPEVRDRTPEDCEPCGRVIGKESLGLRLDVGRETKGLPVLVGLRGDDRVWEELRRARHVHPVLLRKGGDELPAFQALHDPRSLGLPQLVHRAVAGLLDVDELSIPVRLRGRLGYLPGPRAL